jgi:hypothetical protein
MNESRIKRGILKGEVDRSSNGKQLYYFRS